jgi:hypothetical protein
VRRSGKEMMELARRKLPAINAANTLGSGMGYRIVCGIVFLTLALCGCDQQALIQKITTPEQDKVARIYFEDVRTGNFEPVRTAMDPAYRKQMTPELFRTMREVFGTHTVKNISIVGARVVAQKFIGKPGATIHVMTYEIDMGDRFVIGEVDLQDVDGHLQLEGLHVQAASRSIEQENAFSFSGKTIGYFIFLALTILIPIFAIVTEITCWRTLIPRHKWLWRIFVLLGITEFTLNWTTGNIQFLPLQISLLGAGFNQQPYGPLILQIGLPLGAILFWFRRRKWLVLAEENAQHFS